MTPGPIPRTPDWQVEQLDLDAYLDRTGYHGPRTTTTATLSGLYTAHQDAVPFENVTALLGDGVPLGIHALQAKMVDRRRGGYCHEHVLLFGAALASLGFPVVRLAARVRPHAARALPRTHLLLATEADERRVICDIGFGAGLLGPLPLEPGTTRQGDWEYRLERHGSEWLLSGRGSDAWDGLHVFTEEPMLPADAEMANHFIATSPHSPFARRLIVMRTDQTVRRSLLDRTLTTEHSDGRTETRELTTDQALAALRDVFNVHLDANEQAGLHAHLTSIPTAPAPEDAARTDAPTHASSNHTTPRRPTQMFTDAQLAYLSTQMLGRLATIGPDGPQVRPVGFSVDADAGTIEIGGYNLPSTQKWRNIRADHRVAFVVDDLASTDPWRPRALEVRGVAHTHAVADGADRDVIHITPQRVLEMGLDT